jgi:integrase
MTEHRSIKQTLAEVQHRVESSDLSPTRKRDLISAVSRFSKMAGVPPTAFVATPEAIRPILATIRPAAHGITKATYAKVRSNLVAALELAGIADRLPRGRAAKDPAWAPLRGAVQHDKRMSNGLAGFANFCARARIPPEAVNDGVILRFLTWLQTRTLEPRPRDKVRRVPTTWNEARRDISGWPEINLETVSFKPPQRHLPWAALHPAYRRDADAYLELRRRADPFDDRKNLPRRPLAESTLRQQREHLRLAASIVEESDPQGGKVTALATLVEPAAFNAVLRFYHERAQGKANAFAGRVAVTLIDVARYHVQTGNEDLGPLKRIAAKLPSLPVDLTEKNKALLRALESDEVRARLFYLPHQLLAEVAANLGGPNLPFVSAQVAVALDIALVAPLRPQNLCRLNWRRHFAEPNGSRGKLLLHIPAMETKSRKQELVFEPPNDVAKRLRWYRKEILPRLGADPNGDLFVTRGGEPKSQATLSQQMKEIVGEQVGIDMTPHQFRHLAAVLYLEDHPEDFETVRALLGHAWSKTTLVYAGSSSRRAGKAFAGFVAEQRDRLKLKPGARRRPRPGR